MDPDTRWATLLAENQNLRVLWPNLSSDIQTEVERNEELLKIQEDMNNHYVNLISQYETTEKLGQLQDCQENIERLQGKRQNIEYQTSILRERSETETKTKRKSKKRKSRF